MDESPEWMRNVSTARFDNDVFPFWDGLQRHEFLLYRCAKCGTHYWPMTLCRRHGGALLEDMAWVATSGRGTVFSYGVVHRTAAAMFKDEVPYAAVLVELEEGPIFPTRLVGKSPADLRVGMPVEVEYTDVAETGLTLPLFRRRDGAA